MRFNHTDQQLATQSSAEKFWTSRLYTGNGRFVPCRATLTWPPSARFPRNQA